MGSQHEAPVVAPLRPAGPRTTEAPGGTRRPASPQQAEAGDVSEQEVAREVRQPPLLPLLEGALEQVRGLGLVQCQELLSGEMYGPRVIRGPRGIQTLCQDDAQRQH